jgi:hypothetical protein
MIKTLSFADCESNGNNIAIQHEHAANSEDVVACAR